MSRNLKHELAEMRSDKPSCMDYDPIDIIIKTDHAKMRYLYKLYWDHPTAEIRQQLGWQMVRLVMSHASQEEEILYPEFKNQATYLKPNLHLTTDNYFLARVCRRVFGDDVWKEHADADMKLRKILVSLSSMNADRDLQAYDKQMQNLFEVMEPHMCQEEEWLNKLVMTPDVSATDLGRRFQAASRHAVTRPHWWAPIYPPWDTIAKILISPIDNFLDWIRFAGHIPDIHLPPTQHSTKDEIKTTTDTGESPARSRKHADLSPSAL